tara:strand:+ start:454 stop:1266 length:813 start_codon:yes stop_codon:yes gene_type:complete
MVNVTFPDNSLEPQNYNLNLNTGMELNNNEGLLEQNFNNLNNETLYKRILTDISRLLLFSLTSKNIKNYFNGKNYETLSLYNNFNFDKKMLSFQKKFELPSNKGGYTKEEKNAFRTLLRIVEQHEKLIRPNSMNNETKYDALIIVFGAIQSFVNKLRPVANIKGTFFITNIEKKLILLKRLKHNQTVHGMKNVGPSISTNQIENITANNNSYFNKKRKSTICKQQLMNQRNKLIIRIFETCPHLLYTSIPITCKDIRLIRDYVKSKCKST